MRTLFLLAVISFSIAINAQSKQTLVPFLKKNGKYIYVDSATMKPVITKEFAIAGLFDSDDLAYVNENASYTFFSENPGYIINRSGNIAKAGQYELTSQYDDENGFAEIKSADKIGLINRKGMVIIPPVWDEIKSFGETMIAVKSNDKWGYCDLKGSLKIPVKYEEVHNFSEGLAFVKLNDKWGVIDTTGKVIISFLYKDSYPWFSDGIGRVSKDGENWININSEGKEIVPGFSYTEVESFSHGFAQVKRNNKWGLMDTKGNLVVPAGFDSIGYTSWHPPYNIPAAKKDKWGIIDQQGKIVVPFIYDEIRPFYGNRITVVSTGGKYGVLTQEGVLVVPAVYEEVEVLSNKYVMVSVGSKWAIADLNNRLLTGFNFYPLGFNGSDIDEGRGLLEVLDSPSSGLFESGFYIDITGREYREK